MRLDVQLRLLSLNREFYQTFAVDFAASRHRPQPGVPELLARINDQDPILDLGCGNGSLAKALFDNGHQGTYLGLDNSPGLLSWAQDHNEHAEARYRFADLAKPGWSKDLNQGSFKWIFILAVLHHIPGTGRRLQFARELKPLMATNATVVVSVWNFPAEPRFRQRILPWSTLGLSDAELDAGDALLDWRRGGRGLRYVHHFDEAELKQLATTAGCRLVEEHKAGGSSGELNWVQLWQPT